jgi:hypothetical protein
VSRARALSRLFTASGEHRADAEGAELTAPRSTLPLLLAVVAYGLVLSRGARMLGDGDTYWHVAAGNWMLRHLAVPHHDPFSFTMPGAPWIDLEWLGEVLMALAYDAGGWSGLVLLTGLALALALGLLCRRLGRWLPPLPSAAFILLAYLTALPGLLCRPHLLALPLWVVWAGGLFAARADSRAPNWALIPLMTVWANLHGSFPVGLVLAAMLSAEAALAAPPGRRLRVALAWGGFVLASLLAACLTPNLLQGLVHPVLIMRMPIMLRAIDEWQSPDFQSLQPLEIWLVAALWLALSRGVRLPAMRILLLLGLLHAGLQHGRNQILLGFIGPLVLAEPLARFLGPRQSTAAKLLERLAGPARAGAVGAAVLLTALFVLHPIRRGDDSVTPRAALDRLPPALAAKPVLNAYGFGGYLIFRGLRPYIDGRADVYGEAFLGEYLEVLRPRKDKLEAALREHAIAWTVFKPDDGVVALLDTLPGWRRLYADAVAVVHVRSDQS